MKRNTKHNVKDLYLQNDTFAVKRTLLIDNILKRFSVKQQAGNKEVNNGVKS